MRGLTRREQGQSLVEMALVLPLIILLFMGVFDFGRAILTYNSVSEAARNGARVAIVNQTSADICRVTAERATTLALPTTCAANSTAVGVCVTATSGIGSGCQVRCTTLTPACFQTVQVTATFSPITPVIGRILGPITIRASSRVPVESICQPPTTGCPLT